MRRDTHYKTLMLFPFIVSVMPEKCFGVMKTAKEDKEMTKRFLYILMAAVLLLSLCACGGDKTPAETAEPSASPDTVPETDAPEISAGPATGSDIPVAGESNPPEAVTVDQSTVFPLLVGDGGTVFADLNGDGQNEEIRLLSRSSGRDEWLFGSFMINGHEYADEIYEQGFSGYDPDEGYYAITDIDKADGRLEIALQDVGPSSDYTTSFFAWDGTELDYLGTVEGLIFYSPELSEPISFGEVKLDGAGKISTTMRFKVLQTWWGEVEWKLENGELALCEQNVYNAVSENTITTKLEVTAYASQSLDSAKTSLPAGTELTVKACDNEAWVKATDSTGAERWIYLEKGYVVESAGQQQYCWDAFDGLNMAD